MRKIVVLFANYGPYHIARVRAFAERAARDGIQVIGLELARRETEYGWLAAVDSLPFELRTVVRTQLLHEISPRKVIAGMLSTLSEIDPDALAIAGYWQSAMRAALTWSSNRECRPVLMSETWEGDADRRHWIKEWYKGRIVRKFHSALVGGKPQARYLAKLGMDPSRIFTGYDVVDNSVFHPSRTGALPNPCPRPYFLAINRFIGKKNLPFLIRAYSRYRMTCSSPWDLVLCGDGDLRPSLESMAASLQVVQNIHMPGFLQQDQLLPYFAHAGCFIHASTREQWGLVVNEAMAAGLPILVSNRCGCAEDLLVEGENGFSFDPLDETGLPILMKRISEGESERRAMGMKSLSRIAGYSLDAFAEGMLQAASLP